MDHVVEGRRRDPTAVTGSARRVGVSMVQMACGIDSAENVERAEAHVRAAARDGAQIVCLQELFAGRYFPQVVDVRGYDLAEPLPSPTTRRMQTLARELGVVLVVPVYERAMPGLLFNSAVVFDADGSDLGTFRKNHIPDAPQYLEKYYFTPGDLGWPVFRTRFGVIGIAICWDEWFPEASRILGLKGAEIIFYPSAIGSEPDNPELSTREAWKTVIRSHGIANGLFVAAVNRVGTEGGMSFYGGSFIGGPLGEVLVEAGGEEGVVSATVDMGALTFARNLLQFHRDRRPDTYAEILRTSLAMPGM
ncbi:MAG: carbon-nitrogen hydrolase [Thermoleophilia bacterium]